MRVIDERKKVLHIHLLIEYSQGSRATSTRTYQDVTPEVYNMKNYFYSPSSDAYIVEDIKSFIDTAEKWILEKGGRKTGWGVMTTPYEQLVLCMMRRRVVWELL